MPKPIETLSVPTTKGALINAAIWENEVDSDNHKYKTYSVTLEKRMRVHLHKDIEIAWRPTAKSGLTLACKSNARASFDAGRDVHAQRAILFDASGATTGLARVLDDLTHT